MTGLKIRQAIADDSQFVYETKRAAFKEYVEKTFGWDEDEQRQFHNQRFSSQDFSIISLGKNDIGIMAVDIRPDCVKLNQIFVAPDFQGLGIGKVCMLQVIEDARQLELPVRLRVLKVNPRAQIFYARLGFICDGETDTHVLMERTSL